MDTTRDPYEVVIRWSPDDVRYLCPDLSTEDAEAVLADLEYGYIDGGSAEGLAMLEGFLNANGYAVDPSL